MGITSNGLRLLHRLGLYDAISQRAASTETITLHSKKGHTVGSAGMVGWSKEQTGFGLLRVKRTDLMDVLLEAAKSSKIPIHFGKSIVEVKESGQNIDVKFSDGTEDTADFLLGCDGIHSAVRRLYVDSGITPVYSGIAGMGSIIPTSALPSSAASLSGFHATFTADGAFAMLPCTASGDEMYWFFSREVPIPPTGNTRDGWEESGKKEVASLKDNLLDVLGDGPGEWLDTLRQAVKVSDVIKFYPVFKLPPMGKWTNGRCLLLGDAAHAIPPHAGQGISMVLEDVFLFSNFMAQPNLPIQDIVSKYEEKRRGRVDDVRKSAERNGDKRRKVSPWRLELNEFIMSNGIWLYNLFNLDQYGIGQGLAAYDVEAEEL